jgi:hypothetical protein
MGEERELSEPAQPFFYFFLCVALLPLSSEVSVIIKCLPELQSSRKHVLFTILSQIPEYTFPNIPELVGENATYQFLNKVHVYRFLLRFII